MFWTQVKRPLRVGKRAQNVDPFPPRDDIPAEECTVDQLKFKAEAAVL